MSESEAATGTIADYIVERGVESTDPDLDLASCIVDIEEEPAQPAHRSRAVVGGVEHTVGGWGAYEIARRSERWAAWQQVESQARSSSAVAHGLDPRGARAYYGGRSYIHADDAVRSVLGGTSATRPSALSKAASRLGEALARWEDAVCEPNGDGMWECALQRPGAAQVLAVPALTSADLQAFASDPAQQTDPDALADLGEDALIVAASLGPPLANMPAIRPATGLPPMPMRTVPVGDDAAVIKLEAAVAPYVTSIEGMQAALATRLEAVSQVVSEAVARQRRKRIT